MSRYDYCGSIIISRVPKVAEEKKKEKNPNAARDSKENEKNRSRQF